MYQKVSIVVTHPSGEVESFNPQGLEELLSTLGRIQHKEKVYQLQIPVHEFIAEWFHITGNEADKISGWELQEMFITWRISKGYAENLKSSGRNYLYNHLRATDGVMERLPGNRITFHGLKLKGPFMQVAPIDAGDFSDLGPDDLI